MRHLKNKYLLVIAGPTAVGKTTTAIAVAQHFNTSILSADSRQVFRELKIGTAAPSPGQLLEVPHYFIGNKSIHEPYSAGKYEIDAINLLSDLFKTHPVVILAGGSGLYINAVCLGIDDFPETDPEIRKKIQMQFESEGVASLRRDLKIMDPLSYRRMDLKNHKRIQKALEVTVSTGRPYSSFLTSPAKKREFTVIKAGLELNREQLYENINRRVPDMIEKGLEPEARSLYNYKKINALNTVGYKELFSYFDGEISFDEAILSIQSNTRRYARKQLTWFRKDDLFRWFNPSDITGITAYIEGEINKTENTQANGKS